MVNKISVVLVMLLLYVSFAGAGDKGDKAEGSSVECCPLEEYPKVFLMIESSGSSKEVKEFVSKQQSACNGHMGSLSCTVVSRDKEADPLKAGFFLQVTIDRKEELRRSYSHWTTWSDVFYGKYKLSESRDGTWKKADSGKLRISNLRSYEEYLAWVVLREMIAVRVTKVKNAPDGTCKVYGDIKNNTDLQFENISLLAPLDNDTPFVSSVDVFHAVDKLEPGGKDSFSFVAPQQFTGKVGAGSSSATTARAGIVWKKAYVATVGKITIPEKKELAGKNN